MTWLLLAGGFCVLAASFRLRDRRGRAVGQGMAVLLAALGVLAAFRRWDGVVRLPGYGPREWTRP